MQMAFVVKDGMPSLRFETRSTASMLFRHVDLDLADYYVLTWRWYIEEPIESPLDERTREGDDHPARLSAARSSSPPGSRSRPPPSAPWCGADVLGHLCPPCAAPSSNSSLDYRRSDARVVENGFAASSGRRKHLGNHCERNVANL
jgi:hypothetical protein